MLKTVMVVVALTGAVWGQVTSLPNQGGGGGGPITAGRVAFGDGTGTAATDQFFTYATNPVSPPLVSDTFSRLKIADSGSGSSAFGTYSEAYFRAQRTFTVPLIDSNYWETAAIADLVLTPADIAFLS